MFSCMTESFWALRRAVNRSHSCLKELRSGGNFCVACSKKIFGKINFSARLNFNLPGLTASADGGPRRISISGAQTKFSAKIEDGMIVLTDCGGIYILKPSLDRSFENYGDMPANEHVTMQMARQIFKIPTAESALIYFGSGEPLYLTRRFDVLANGDRCVQNDFAQIAGLTPEENGEDYKYTALSYEGIAKLMKLHVSAYPVAAGNFFRTIFFNYLVCNGDAHAKNFSLRESETPGVYELTPAYDLLNTALHIKSESSRTALDLFQDEINFQTDFYEINGFYGTPDFLEFARRIGVVESRAKRFILRTIAAVPAMEAMLGSSFLSEESKMKYKACIRDRAQALNI